MFVARIKTAGRKSAVCGDAATRVGTSENKIIIKFIFTWRDRRVGNFERLREIFERRVLTHFDVGAVLKIKREMKIDVLGLQTPGRIDDIVDLPMRANIANPAMPSFGTPRV